MVGLLIPHQWGQGHVVWVKLEGTSEEVANGQKVTANSHEQNDTSFSI